MGLDSIPKNKRANPRAHEPLSCNIQRVFTLHDIRQGVKGCISVQAFSYFVCVHGEDEAEGEKMIHSTSK